VSESNHRIIASIEWNDECFRVHCWLLGDELLSCMFASYLMVSDNNLASFWFFYVFSIFGFVSRCSRVSRTWAWAIYSSVIKGCKRFFESFGGHFLRGGCEMKKKEKFSLFIWIESIWENWVHEIHVLCILFFVISTIIAAICWNN
jgi:hypothetical protein